ncbi:TonB-dependent receptor [Candidatus Marinimicrobia bacterium]|nr:TonB-dependent receptor [Candidatus Neomarinimicrobiota bacterium]
MIKIFLHLLMLVSFLNANGSLSGKIFDKINNFGLADVNIILKSQSEEFGSSSDQSGVFKIESIPRDSYELSISYIGFEKYKKKLEIKDESLVLDIGLNIKPIEMEKLEILSEANLEYQNVPGSATVLDAQSIKLINPIGTQEMLDFVAGVNSYSDDGIGNSRVSVGIRGLNPRRSSRVLILEDGVPIQPALYVYPNMYYNPPAERIEELEVIKGSGAIKYGPQTMGGVINYFTKKPRNDYGGLFKLTSGENGYGSFFIEAGGWGKNKLKPEFQFLLKKGDGFRDNNEFYQLNSTLKASYRHSPNKNTYIKVNFNFEDSEATYTGLTEWSFENDPNYNPKENDNFKIFRLAADVIQTERISNRISKNTTLFTSYFDRRWWRENDIFILASDLNNSEALPVAPTNTFNDLARTGNGIDNFGILRTFYVGGIERSYKINHNFFQFKSKMEIGFRGYWERFIDDRKAGKSVDDRIGYYYSGTIDDPIVTEGQQSHHYESTAFSSFIEESIILGNLNLRPGFRFEIFEQERVDRLKGSLYLDKTEYVILPGFGFTQSIGNLKFFGGIHRGYTPPSSGALKILNFGENTSDVSGLDLKSEKSWNKEIGFRTFSDLYDFESSFFHVGIENLVAAGRGTAFKNLGKIRNSGIEVNGKIKLSYFQSYIPNLNISYTYLSTKILEGKIASNIKAGGAIADLEGNELPYAPKNNLNIGIESTNSKKLSFRIDMRYVSEVFTDFENITKTANKGIKGPIPAYQIYNLSSRYNINSKCSIFFSGKNITDEIYIGSRLHSNPGQEEANLSSGIIPGPRRQLNCGLEYKF